MVSCRPFDDNAGGFTCAAFEILLSSLSNAQDPRRFDTDLDPQTVPLDSKFFCFLLIGTVGKYGTFTSIFKKITSH
jgi:hypothetical protein